jgi:glyoxylase-like metal-dependent hydrolase (beta-lactamase superfamily II)/rhodanese-related sulfurtransferase
MNDVKEIDANTLREWLDSGKKLNLLDVRPIPEREEWQIPGSIHANVYDKLKANNPEALQGIALDQSIPVVTICAGGRTSLIAAELLISKGYEAYNLHGGMKGWSMAWNSARLSFPNFDIIQFRRTGKGCLSYMIISENKAMVIDASLPIEVYQEQLQNENAELIFVADTHIHADHLSRSILLAGENNIIPHLPINDKVVYDFQCIEDNMIFELGRIKIKAISTPGHTNESTSYLIDGKALLTGDTLFINGVGRPDLKADTEEAISKSKMLYNSLKQIFSFDQGIIVLPGHTSKPVAFDGKPIQATLQEIKSNIPMLMLGEEEFANTILQRIPATPSNYPSIVEKNIQGDFSNINPLDLEAGANRCAVS